MTEKRTARRSREQSSAYEASALSERELKSLTRRIVRAAHPEMIILFGSRAYGKPRSGSDLDLMVVIAKDGSPSERVKRLRAVLPRYPFTLDIHARTPDELTHRLQIGDDFMQEIVGRGKRLYAARTRNGLVQQVERALEQGRTEPMDNAEVVQEWVEKAEGDYVTAQVIMRQRKSFRANNLCWNCEQCIEKYLKAFLTRHRVKFKRDHNLDELLKLCLSVDGDFRLIQKFVDTVSICKPNIRYPGNNVSEADARAAFAATKPIRKFMRAKLGLGTQ